MKGRAPDPEILRALMAQMLRIRRVEERIAERYAEQEMRCPVHLCIGQEAIAAGVCQALSPDDYVLSGHRSHGHYLARGGDLRAMMAEIYGKATGCARGNGGSMHLVDLARGFLGAAPIVAGTIPIAVGVAFGTAMRGESRVTVSFFGEGATEEGTFHESLNFAALKGLPILFVCENNRYSVYSPPEVRQPAARSITGIARAHGIEALAGDGNDAVAVYGLALDAVRKARGGGGPTLLELETYRWREHCGPNYDNDLGYRTEAEFLAWKARCPIDRLRGRLLDEGLMGEGEFDRILRAVDEEMDGAFAFAKESPFPAEERLRAGVYAT